MADTIQLLTELEAEIANGTTDEASETLRKLAANYADGSVSERALSERALLARRRGELADDERSTVEVYLESSTELVGARSSVLLNAVAFISGGADLEQSEVVERVDELVSLESTVADRRSRMASVLAGVSLPAAVSVLSLGTDADTIDVGESTRGSATVANVGDGVALNVTASLESPADLAFTPATIDVGVLDSRMDTTVEFEVSGRSPGNYAFVFGVRSRNAGADNRGTRVIVDGGITSDVSDLLNEVPEWAPLVGGAGVAGLGVGAGLYKLLSRDRDGSS